ncbi:polysaccharide biosynthesis protein [Morganella morganii]
MSIIDSFFSIPRPYKRVVSVFIDFIFIQIAFWGAFWTRLGTLHNTSSSDYIYLSLFISIITIFSFIRLGYYRAILRYLSINAIITLSWGSSISAIVFLLTSYFCNIWIPRSVTIIYLGYLFLLTGGSRVTIRMFFSQRCIKQKANVVVYGAGVAGRQLVNILRQGNKLNPIAFMDDNPKIKNSIIQGLLVYCRDDFIYLLNRYHVSKVLLALPSASRIQRRSIIESLAEYQIEVLSIPNLDDITNDDENLGHLRDVPIEDLLGREPVKPIDYLMTLNINKKSVMVTGAGGSIGSELCRQIIKLNPTQLVLFELSEYALYKIERELLDYKKKKNLDIKIIPLIGSVQNIERLKIVMSTFNVNTVYHAAAYKHVPMVEYNVIEGIYNNVLGTYYTAKAAVHSNVQSFVLISTDKAVRPTNIMGTTKRLAELSLQALANIPGITTRFCMVRFGNVLGSSGSVIPLFKKQIRSGGPITITHPDIIRYFMTIPEAAQLVIQAGAMGHGGDVFVLDMGEPVKIIDLAKNLVKLSGLEIKSNDNPYGDIELKVTGLRPGEKLYKELLIGNNVVKTEHSRIMTANESYISIDEYDVLFNDIIAACDNLDLQKIRYLLISAPTGFQPKNNICDLVWAEKNK